MIQQRIHLILTVLLVVQSVSFSQFTKSVRTAGGKTSTQALPGVGYETEAFIRAKLDINNIASWFHNNGEFYFDHVWRGPGFEWPKGGQSYIVFSAGIWMGGIVQGHPRVATSGHGISEFRPGRILTSGLWEDPSLPHLRVYRVRPLVDSPTSNPDYAGWPVDQGAPWIDVDGDGVWDPMVDRPGIQWESGPYIPDMMLFSVFNDADPSGHLHRWGQSEPLGVEVRRTAWAHEGGFADEQFIRYQFHNKSNHWIYGMYVSLWSDIDIGASFDIDCAGVDIGTDGRGRPHNLGYGYKGIATDPQFGNTPPAMGFKLVQGPMVPGMTNDTAVAFGKRWPGFTNQNLSAFNVFCNPGTAACGPAMYDPSGFVESYRILQGKTPAGQQWINPVSGLPTSFMFSGDPVAGTGWLHTTTLPPTDIRASMTVGPFTLAPGDSQEVVYAAFVGRGTDRLQSITELRRASQLIQYAYDTEFQIVPTVRVYPSPSYVPPLLVNARSDGALAMHAILKSATGTILGSAPLFDDGMHGDSLAGDGLFGNWLHTASHPSGAILSLTVEYASGDTVIWPAAFRGIPTIGPVRVSQFTIQSDNVNGDLTPNPGEHILYRIGLTNFSTQTVSGLRGSVSPVAGSFITPTPAEIFTVGTLAPGGSGQMLPNSVLAFTVRSDAPTGELHRLLVTIQDDSLNEWQDTLSVTVQPYLYPPVDVVPLHTQGFGQGAPGVLITDYSQLQNNEYRIIIQRMQNASRRFHLVNVNTGDTLLHSHPYPDEFGHNVPVTEGFRITRGTAELREDIYRWEYHRPWRLWFRGARRGTGIFATTGFPHFDGGLEAPAVRYPGNLLRGDQLRTVEIRFSAHATQRAYRYLERVRLLLPAQPPVDSSFVPYILQRGVGMPYQDYEMFPLGDSTLGRTVPFTVWEIDHVTNSERQLNIAFSERNDTLWRPDSVYYGKGKIDGKWFPTVHITGGSELLHIFGSTYSDSANPFYTTKNLQHQSLFDISYTLWVRLVDTVSSFVEGDRFRIIPYFPITTGDVFTFNPTHYVGVTPGNDLPVTYALLHNYPNPFNPSTTIRYELPKTERVLLEVYNILGQRVRVLVDDVRQAGRYEVVWDGRSDAGMGVASGVYFYRLRTEGFMAVKKMLVLR